jgi:hypothetical protein
MSFLLCSFEVTKRAEICANEAGEIKFNEAGENH